MYPHIIVHSQHWACSIGMNKESLSGCDIPASAVGSGTTHECGIIGSGPHILSIINLGLCPSACSIPIDRGGIGIGHEVYTFVAGSCSACKGSCCSKGTIVHEACKVVSLACSRIIYHVTACYIKRVCGGDSHIDPAIVDRVCLCFVKIVEIRTREKVAGRGSSSSKGNRNQMINIIGEGCAAGNVPLDGGVYTGRIMHQGAGAGHSGLYDNSAVACAVGQRTAHRQRFARGDCEYGT